ncbi:MAG: hypothetical protein ACK56I_01240, partial [bacterium]
MAFCQRRGDDSWCALKFMQFASEEAANLMGLQKQFPGHDLRVIPVETIAPVPSLASAVVVMPYHPTLCNLLDNESIPLDSWVQSTFMDLLRVCSG